MSSCERAWTLPMLAHDRMGAFRQQTPCRCIPCVHCLNLTAAHCNAHECVDKVTDLCAAFDSTLQHQPTACLSPCLRCLCLIAGNAHIIDA
eukprot:842922-Pelagomonas_calceolata.AAC.2